MHCWFVDLVNSMVSGLLSYSNIRYGNVTTFSGPKPSQRLANIYKPDRSDRVKSIGIVHGNNSKKAKSIRETSPGYLNHIPPLDHSSPLFIILKKQFQPVCHR